MTSHCGSDNDVNDYERVVASTSRLTDADATKALRRAAMASLRGPHAEGYRCARFKIAPVLAAVACLVLQ